MCFVLLGAVITITVAVVIWVGYNPPPPPVRDLAFRWVGPRQFRGNRGNLQGVLTVQHQRRTAANRNSDTHTDTLSVYLNHREMQDLQSSEWKSNYFVVSKLNLHATQP